MIVNRRETITRTHEFPLIIITGFMGTGKTETAMELSKIIGFEFIDTDVLVERLAGRPVTKIIEEKGEDHFRALEAEVCKRLYEKRGAVIATGGGTLLNEETFTAFSNSGTIVILEASIDSLLERLTGDVSRPLLEAAAKGEAELREKINSLLVEREEVYGRISLRIDTSKITPREAACRIAAGLKLPSAVFFIGAGGDAAAGRSGSTVEVGRGILSKIGERLGERGLTENVVLLMPEVVRKRFFSQIKASLDAAGIQHDLIAIEDGEHKKTLANAAFIMDKIIETGAPRDSTIMPIGGGVTGDIGGFVASIYMRGIHLVHVPTTLLAQVDSSIGGKTGVDHEKAKNLIGTFHQPDLVLCDPCTLRTLPLEEISSGMAEVIKTALIGSAELFEFLETSLAVSGNPALRQALRSVDFLERCVSECVAVKGAIVEEDPFESDVRRILNLGHTVGHALESACEYMISHGQAVALGLTAALKIAAARGLLEESLLDRTVNLLKRCKLPVTFPAFDEEAFLRSLYLDKKQKNKRIHFVLPMQTGRVKIVDDVTNDEILSAIRKERK